MKLLVSRLMEDLHLVRHYKMQGKIPILWSPSPTVPSGITNPAKAETKRRHPKPERKTITPFKTSSLKSMEPRLNWNWISVRLKRQKKLMAKLRPLKSTEKHTTNPPLVLVWSPITTFPMTKKSAKPFTARAKLKWRSLTMTTRRRPKP